MTTAVTSQGQVTIPKPVRDRPGLTTGSLVSFERTETSEVALVKTDTKRPPSRFAAFLGIAKGGMTTDEIMAPTRGED